MFLPPELTFPKDFSERLELPINFTWNETTDKDGDPITYRHIVWQVDEVMDDNQAKPITGSSGNFGYGKKCALWTFLIGLMLLAILYFLGLKDRIKVLIWLALGVIILTILAYFYCKKSGNSNSYSVTNLEPNKSYFWKVIAEDGNGGKTESEIWRFDVK